MVRILPGLATTGLILEGAALFEKVLRIAVDSDEIAPGPSPGPESLIRLLG